MSNQFFALYILPHTLEKKATFLQNVGNFMKDNPYAVGGVLGGLGGYALGPDEDEETGKKSGWKQLRNAILGAGLGLGGAYLYNQFSGNNKGSVDATQAPANANKLVDPQSVPSLSSRPSRNVPSITEGSTAKAPTGNISQIIKRVEQPFSPNASGVNPSALPNVSEKPVFSGEVMRGNPSGTTEQVGNQPIVNRLFNKQNEGISAGTTKGIPTTDATQPKTKPSEIFPQGGISLNKMAPRLLPIQSRKNLLSADEVNAYRNSQ